jgi:FkbM family methyltransferase
MPRQSHKNILRYRFLGSESFQAYAVILLFLQGKLTFRESIQPLLQGGFKTKDTRTKFRHLFFELVNKRYGSFELYGRPFSPASENYVEATAWIDEVITKDQYQTGLIKDGSIVIDAGANIGVFSVKVAHENSSSKIYSFEPTPRTFDALKRNTETYPNISIFNLGLGDEVTEKKITIWDNFSGSNTIGGTASPEYGAPDRVENIKITTIDEVAKGLSRVDFIKMDTEGYEANILKGAAETIKRWRPIIAMSSYHNPNDKEELPRLLKSICPEYVCELRHDAEEDMICRVAQ